MSRYTANIITKSPATPTGPTTTGRAPGIWRMDDVAYWTKQGLWPNANISAPDTYFPYVSLLLSTTALGNANNNLFVDSSGAFNPVSRNGNTTQGSFSPYNTNWSNYFDGSGDYLTVPSNAALAFGTGDFTIEFWTYRISGANTDNFIISSASNGGFFFGTKSNGWGYGSTGNFWSYNTGVIPALNTWQHVAVSRSGSSLRIFVDGTQIGTTQNDSSDWSLATGGTTIGSQGASYYYNGYISNLRVLKGTALYTSNFTPPTSPLTAITNTSLLTCQSNRFRDASTNNFTITAAGNTSVTNFGPFILAYPGITYNQSDITNWSGYFDGSGDYLSAPSNAAFAFGTGDFTLECWAYLDGNPGVIAGIFDTRNSSSSSGGILCQIDQDFSNALRVEIGGSQVFLTSQTVPLRQWNHIAIVRSSGTVKAYLNGSAMTGGSAANSTNITDTNMRWGGDRYGYYVYGYISNARVVKGTAVYTSNFTPPTTNLTAISGTSLLTLQNAAFTDNSTNNFVLTPNGNTTVTGNSPFNTVGYWSNYFDGSGDYLQMPSNAAFAFGTGDYTIEGWIYVTVGGLNQRITWFSDDRHNIDLNTSNQIFLYDGTIRTFGTVTVGTWNHFAVSRTGGTVSCYLNGVRGYNASETTNSSTRSMNIAANNAGNGYFNGYISNIRVVKGTGVYSGATITVPTTPLTAITNTSLLTCQNGRFIDNSTNAFTITANGNTSVQSFDPFYTATIASNGGSMYFDGSGDWLDAPSSSSLGLSTGSFTVEGWIYPTSTASNAMFWAGTTSGALFIRLGQYGGTAYSGIQIGRIGVANDTFSAFSFTAGQWYHIAVVRNGSTMTIYVNGTSINSFSNTTDYGSSATARIGATESGGENYSGYISNLRVVKGTAVYTSAFTPPTAPVTPTAATTLLVNGMNAGIYDATAINDMETVGNAQVTTAVSKYGGSSVYFDGSGDYLVSRGNTILLGSGNFTVEFWVYFNAVNNGTVKYLYDFRTASATSASFLAQEANNTWTYWNGAGSSVNTGLSGSTFATGQWYHVAITRSSNVLYCFVNGIKVSSDPTDNSNYASATMTLGARYSGSDGLNGYIDDVRLTAGVARYTANFTPPDKAFPTY